MVQGQLLTTISLWEECMGQDLMETGWYQIKVYMVDIHLPVSLTIMVIQYLLSTELSIIWTSLQYDLACMELPN